MRILLTLITALPLLAHADGNEINIPVLPPYAVPALPDTPAAPPSPPPTDALIENAAAHHPLAAILTHMKHGRWQAAQAQADALLAAEPDNLNALFLAGQIAEQLRQPQQAAAHYRAMLAQNSRLPRPRLELAKVLWQSGEAEAAEHHFRLAQSLPLPADVQTTVQRYLHALQRERRSWQLSAAIEPGSNINQGSRHDSVEINGERYTLSRDNQAKSGIGLSVQAGGRYRFGSQRQWFVEGNTVWREHSGRLNDSLSTRLQIGRTFSSPDGVQRLQTSLGGQHVRYRRQTLYSGALAKIDYSRQLGNNAQWLLGWESQQLHYRPEYRYMRAHQHWLNTGISGTIGGRSHYRTNLYSGLNRAKEKAYSFHSVGAEASLRHHFDWQQITLGGHLGYQRNRYHGQAPFFGKTRQEQRHHTGLSVLKRNWSWHGFAPELSLQYSRTRANIPLYDSRSKQLQLQFSKTF